MKLIKCALLVSSLMLLPVAHGQTVSKAVQIDSNVFNAEQVHTNVIELTVPQSSQVTFLLVGNDKFDTYTDSSGDISAEIIGRKAIVNVGRDAQDMLLSASFTTVCGLDVTFKVNALKKDKFVVNASGSFQGADLKVVIQTPSACTIR